MSPHSHNALQIPLPTALGIDWASIFTSPAGTACLKSLSFSASSVISLCGASVPRNHTVCNAKGQAVHFDVIGLTPDAGENAQDSLKKLVAEIQTKVRSRTWNLRCIEPSCHLSFVEDCFSFPADPPHNSTWSALLLAEGNARLRGIYSLAKAIVEPRITSQSQEYVYIMAASDQGINRAVNCLKEVVQQQIAQEVINREQLSSTHKRSRSPDQPTISNLQSQDPPASKKRRTELPKLFARLDGLIQELNSPNLYSDDSIASSMYDDFEARIKRVEARSDSLEASVNELQRENIMLRGALDDAAVAAKGFELIKQIIPTLPHAAVEAVLTALSKQPSGQQVPKHQSRQQNPVAPYSLTNTPRPIPVPQHYTMLSLPHNHSSSPDRGASSSDNLAAISYRATYDRPRTHSQHPTMANPNHPVPPNNSLGLRQVQSTPTEVFRR